MRYKLYKKVKKNEGTGGSYWKDSDFAEHLKLTSYQTTYLHLLQNYPPPQKILEAGCGIGRWAIPLSQQGYLVTGIEIEEPAIKIIKENHAADNLTLIQGDIYEMGFQDKTFDIILSLGVLEHFEDPLIQQKAILEHVRVLKDGGILLITVPYLSLIRLLFHLPYLKILALVRRVKKKEYHFSEYRYSKREFQKIIEKCNLKIGAVVYDDFSEPFSFGLTVDYPINRLFRSKDGIEYKTNKAGKLIFRMLWNTHPSLVSGGIGFICQKKI